MRRKDREVTDINIIEGIIAKSRVLRLGLFDGEYPYVVPLHYGYKMKDGKLTFYMHSAKEGHKLDCITANPKVFVEIDRGEEMISGGEVACKYGARFESVMCRGTATLLEPGEEKNEALASLMMTQTGKVFEITDAMASAVCVIKVEVETYTAKIHE